MFIHAILYAILHLLWLILISNLLIITDLILLKLSDMIVVASFILSSAFMLCYFASVLCSNFWTTLPVSFMFTGLLLFCMLLYTALKFFVFPHSPCFAIEGIVLSGVLFHNTSIWELVVFADLLSVLVCNFHFPVCLWFCLFCLMHSNIFVCSLWASTLFFFFYSQSSTFSLIFSPVSFIISFIMSISFIPLNTFII